MTNRGMDPKMMKRIQQLQARLAEAQQKLEETSVEASAGGGAVTVVMSAQPKLESITIQAEVVDPNDVEMLQDLIDAATNETLEKIRAAQAQLMGGLDVPGLPM